MPDNNELLLRAILSATARQAFPPDRLAEIINSGRAGQRQLKAYNLCDGTRGQAEIAKALKLDQGNFSRTVNRWVDAGVVVRLGEGRESTLLHVYPLPETGSSKELGK